MEKRKEFSRVEYVLGILFVAALLLANILASKQLQIFQWSVPAGVLCFPISYIISDVAVSTSGTKYKINLIVHKHIV